MFNKKSKNKLNKSKGIIINNHKFALTNPKIGTSKEINILQKSFKELHNYSKDAPFKNLEQSNWSHIGTKECVLHKSRAATIMHEAFISLLMKNKTQKKSVLVIGPAHGYEVKQIKENIQNTKIDTFDILDGIDTEYLKLIRKKIVNLKGIENYVNKKMIGNYDGITAVYSAGWWTKHPERNLFKIALMLKPKGVALISVSNSLGIKTIINNIFKRFKLDKQFIVNEGNLADYIIIKRV